MTLTDEQYREQFKLNRVMLKVMNAMRDLKETTASISDVADTLEAGLAQDWLMVTKSGRYRWTTQADKAWRRMARGLPVLSATN